ncbi:MAG: hypothetical protein IGS50_15605 [Synechococcales cyanobacterium C42_A2020_086]|jgi:hypothetical protein|nr:hypothetical protein [Synechococcales cyanobacterium M58_A2018_015]MBF2075168.1 hypothetical protein [Synechococcales cyanobacterium C42_A2020_086]
MNIQLTTETSFDSVGYLGSKLYMLGWQNRLHKHLSICHHFLLSIFLYYRKGFSAAATWLEKMD